MVCVLCILPRPAFALCLHRSRHASPSIIAFITILILTIGCSGDSSNVAENKPGTPGWGAGTPGRTPERPSRRSRRGRRCQPGPARSGERELHDGLRLSASDTLLWRVAALLSRLEDSQCPTGAACNNGTCLTAACTPGRRCVRVRRRHVTPLVPVGPRSNVLVRTPSASTVRASGATLAPPCASVKQNAWYVTRPPRPW